ncbi:MAG: heavy-metal-associated domain-containing protein [Bacteroidia bacterium]|nr:heavy-metal-associated domain-containing protein [Bacteroidia bacterium]
METLKFKTTINCGGCIAKVTPFLNGEKGIEKWEIDTNNADKVLTVETADLSAQKIIETVKKSGFKIELLK